jgi:hypothetical protein
MDLGQGFSMRSFRKAVARHGRALVLALPFAAGPISVAHAAVIIGERGVDAAADLGGNFLRQLLENSAHRLAGDAQGCLTTDPTLGGEIAAILGYVAADEVNMALTSSCQEESGNANFCTLSFSTTAGEEQASAGFVFRADPADQRIDLDSVRCFQTP